MNQKILGILAAVTLGAPAALGPQQPLDAKNRPNGDPYGAETRAGTLSMEDQTFMRKAAESGMAEVKLAKLALDKSRNDEVKRFAQKLIDDHQKANDDLKQIATQKGFR